MLNNNKITIHYIQYYLTKYIPFIAFFKILPYIYHKLFKIKKEIKRPSIYNNSILSSMFALYDSCHFIIDNIYVGSSLCASNYNLLKFHNIKYIINITDTIPNFFENDIRYLNIDIKDDGLDSLNQSQIENSFNMIHQSQIKKQNILIHCFVGRSRSVSITIYYLMKKYNLNYESALSIIKNKRIYANPSIHLKNNIIHLFHNQ